MQDSAINSNSEKPNTGDQKISEDESSRYTF